ncbi:hypothetical protein H2202_009042 [Exophiala xenobiotica]|nr:hypothetical protein H2202_009042 [Exophiala xenobiotica]
MSSPATTATPILLQLIEDYHSFNPGGVPVLPYPTYLDFSKQVNRGRPCVYRLDPDDQPARQSSQVNGSSRLSKLRTELGSILSCPALSWTKESLCAKVTQHVEVAVTPDGRADSLYPLPRDSPSPKNDRIDTNANAETSDLSNGGGRQHEDLEAASEHEPEQEEVFVQPATLNMSLSSLFDKLCRPFGSDNNNNDNTATPNDPPQQANSIYYLQSQNSNLTTTPLSPLLSDLPRNLPFAEPVLGDPEAINIWMGTGASVTSTHRDPYENLYLVLRGKKKFTLYAPVEEVCLHASKVRTAHHVLEPDGSFRIALDTPHQPSSSASSSSPNTANDTHTGTDANDSDSESDSEAGTDDNRIPWIPIDPLNLPTPDVLASKYPYYQYSHPLTVTVSEGEILYLPAGWFHHVSQECGVWDDGEIAPCIAVNYWYDMDYEGEKYAMREMLGRLVEAARRETDQRKQS